ncbi:hypothetical protein COJ02_27545 [Bacillus thuringiensis]|uniref:hypothetical protein n=1 Tax=Bacillus thuringiensis TaxID=1428 RepID=UPI000BF9E191|nr:hypothetical protein [Bacillus thuringiensis]PFJ49814.1 hypothetical protein COJ02_27545 [Bacillus thuringiensis]
MSAISSLMEKYGEEIKGKIKEIAERAKARINAGEDITKVINAHNDEINNVGDEFITRRTAEYREAREKDPRPNIEAEVDSVHRGQARHSDNTYRDYDAPTGMTFDNLEWNPVTEIGDTNKEYQLKDGGIRVWVHINARSRYKPDGKSHILVQPTIYWKYIEREIALKVAEEWKQLYNLAK